MNNQITTTNSEASQKEQNQIILYRPNDTISLEVRLEDETVWLSQAQIVTLFNSTKSNISEHIKHIYTDKELEKESTVRFFRTVQQEGKRTSLPPLEGIFQNGQIFDAYNFACVIQMLYFCK